MFFLSHYTQINPKINPCKIKFVVEGAVYNALRLMSVSYTHLTLPTT